MLLCGDAAQLVVSDWHAIDADLKFLCGQGFFSLSELLVKTLTVYDLHPLPKWAPKMGTIK